MNKEVTLGQVIMMLFTLTMGLLGWGVSVEVRLSEMKSSIALITRMQDQQTEMYKLIYEINGDVKELKGRAKNGGTTNQ